MKTNFSRTLWLFVFFHPVGFVQQQASSQTTPQPTVVAGQNSIAYDSVAKTYVFYYDSIPMYRYEMTAGGSYWGSFYGLRASRTGSDYIFPARCGGIVAEFSGDQVFPCDDGVSFELGAQFMNSDSVALLWQMVRNDDERYSYWMSFQIEGKTLIIDIEGADGNQSGEGVFLSEGYSDIDTTDFSIVPVPYFTFGSLLYKQSSQSFTSMFFDWEMTNCSSIEPLVLPGHLVYAQSVHYYPTTENLRNRIRERIYLTISHDVDQVMPNIVGPTAPLKNKLENKIILSFQPPFHWIFDPVVPNTSGPSYLDSLGNLGIADLALLIKEWWWSGFDRGNPNVLPANNFIDMGASHCHDFETEGGGGGDVLRQVRESVQNHGFLFGLHQNYVDMYSDSRPDGLPGINVEKDDYVAQLPVDGGGAWAFDGNCLGQHAWAIRPSRAAELAKNISSTIYSEYLSDWNYLDVTSAINPSGPTEVGGEMKRSYVDFDATRDSAGMFLYALHSYRSVPEAVRENTNNGPTQGEGRHHFLYTGYFDDLEARVSTAIPSYFGYWAPLLLDFQLRKLRSKSSFHGGHLYEFYGSWNQREFSGSDLHAFVATELAYGVGGLVTGGWHTNGRVGPLDHSLRHAALEQKHVLPMQKLLTEAEPIQIQYSDGAGEFSASEYIVRHPTSFTDTNSTDFMGRVKVVYDNGVTVYVNRLFDQGDSEEDRSWDVTVGSQLDWFNYHAIIDGKDSLGVGAKPVQGSLKLPPNGGWVCASPFWPTNSIWTGPRPIGGWWGNETQGGGIAAGNVNTISKPDLVTFWVDNPQGSNRGWYRVGWDVDDHGRAQSWTEQAWFGDSSAWWGHETDGADIALAQIDVDSSPELVAFWIDDHPEGNTAYYRIGWNMNTNGTVSTWSQEKIVGDTLMWWGDLNQGAGIAIGNIDANTQPEMLLLSILDSQTPCANSGFYRIGWNLESSGDPSSWTDTIRIGDASEWWGCETHDAGLTLGNFDSDSRTELIVFWIDNTGDANTGFYRIGWNLDATGLPTGGWTGPFLIGQVFGNPEDQGAGIAATNLNGGYKELIAFNISNPNAFENQGYYRVGFDINLSSSALDVGKESMRANLPEEFALHQNYPNPFNPTTTITYDLPIDSKVTLKLYDILGREVQTLVNEDVRAGYHKAILNAHKLATGVYFYRIQTGGFTSTRKMILLH